MGDRTAKFDYSLDFKGINFRERPGLYKIGRGEQGVLTVEPYKSEILPHWRFRTPEVARASSEKIFALYEDYKVAGDFVGMDMARKFLQMGYTRERRRYANHAGGRKYAPGTRDVLPFQTDATKAAAAAVFREKWEAVKADPEYQRLGDEHRRKYS